MEKVVVVVVVVVVAVGGGGGGVVVVVVVAVGGGSIWNIRNVNYLLQLVSRGKLGRKNGAHYFESQIT